MSLEHVLFIRPTGRVSEDLLRFWADHRKPESEQIELSIRVRALQQSIKYHTSCVNLRSGGVKALILPVLAMIVLGLSGNQSLIWIMLALFVAMATPIIILLSRWLPLSTIGREFTNEITEIRKRADIPTDAQLDLKLITDFIEIELNTLASEIKDYDRRMRFITDKIRKNKFRREKAVSKGNFNRLYDLGGRFCNLMEKCQYFEDPDTDILAPDDE